ncbi:HDOD domain-containing protein [Desulfovibrio ferrophilus]|uniref:histidine kinase n=1 Tax=Desulfovibrio ferrophilus TaxID=241368 RepID=A0A2Z6B3P7_9BACT|nr:HDOD domain-containing protein [Desulfovibrio ferrophilus]BBD10058.1 histidine kinase [Desulfovibrio ferrophilus]
MHTGESPTDAPNIRNIVRHIEELPAPPSVATKILNSVLADDVDFHEVSELIESDQTLTLKVLRMANSMGYGYRGKIENVEQAIATIGFDSLKTSLLSVIIRDSLYKDAQDGDPLLTHIWKHTLACAVASSLVAEHALPQLKDVAFAAGMVHDCGQLVLLSAMAEDYEPLVKQCIDGETSLLDLETEVLGVEHTLVGKWLLSAWKMPRRLIDSAWLHHQGPETLHELGEEGRLVAAVALGDILAHEVMHDGPTANSEELRVELVASFGFDESTLESIKGHIGEGFAKRAEAFDLENDAALFYFQALQRANAKLSGINTQLAAREDRLKSTNALLCAVAAAGPRLAKATETDDVFRAVERAVRDGLGAGRVFAYRIDAGGKILEGLLSDNGKPYLFSVLLDNDLRPLWGKSDIEPPKSLHNLLASYLTRIPADDPADDHQPRPIPVPPWQLLPLLAEDGFLGEVGIEPPIEAALLPEQTAALAQLTCLAAAALHRLELHDRLEERADRLSSALRKIRRMNHKLLQTERLAAVGQLAAGAAHEINNPLAIIYARAQLLEFHETNEKKKHDFQQMMTQIERITAILINLMDFARPAPPRMDTIALEGVVRRSLSLVESGLSKQGVTLDARLDSLPSIIGDGNQLEQVVLNLLINAEHAVIEARPEGTGRIKVRAGIRADKAVLTISDNGIGIKAENLNKIFDPFFTTKEEGKGTGLGLSTSYGIIQSHGGDIRFHSVPGKGTEVTVVLPLSTPDERSEVLPTQPGSNQAKPILVVDDEKHIRDILRESLEAQGYRVETANDGEQGLAKLKTSAYRLLLLDIRMPSRDGLSLLSEAKSLIGGMPVIVLTGMAGPEEIEKALKFGAYKCVRKPFQIDALLQDISAALKPEDTV